MVAVTAAHQVARHSVSGAAIKIVGLQKFYGTVHAVRDFSIEIRAGEFISILGASGSGKTSVLRMLAGLEDPSDGQVLIDGRETVGLPPEKRDIGLVFQDYALFPHMSVRDNVAFPLRMRAVPRSEISEMVRDILAMVGAGHLADRRPNQLSGGQQQRIALARALVFRPKLLLLDEPLSALDKNLREHMKAEIKTLHRMTGATILYVTHDQSEALALSDRIIVMRDGRIIDVNTPSALYQAPTSSYLASFIGDANLFDGLVQLSSPEAIRISTPLGVFELPTASMQLQRELEPGETLKIVVRPENLMVRPADSLPGLLRCKCRIEEMLYNGAHTVFSLVASGSQLRLIARCGAHQMSAFQVGEVVEVGVRTDRAVVVTDDGEISTQ